MNSSLHRVRLSLSSARCRRHRRRRTCVGCGGGGVGRRLLRGDRSDRGGRLVEGDLGVIRDGLSRRRWRRGGGDVSGSGSLDSRRNEMDEPLPNVTVLS